MLHETTDDEDHFEKLKDLADPLIDEQSTEELEEETSETPVPAATKHNVLSMIFFTYMSPLIWNALWKPLTYWDLITLRNSHKSKAAYASFSKIWREEKRKQNPSLASAIWWKWLGKKYIYSTVLGVFSALLTMVDPYLIGRIVSSIQRLSTNSSTGNEWGFVFFLACNHVLYNTLRAISMDTATNITIKMRTVLISEMYRTLFRMRNTNKIQARSNRHTVSVLTNDIDYICALQLYSSSLFGDFLGVLAGVFLLMLILGTPMFVVLLYSIIFFISLAYISYKWFYLHKEMMKAADARASVIAQIIAGINTIKSYLWERSFAESVKAKRHTEVEYYVRLDQLILYTVTGLAVLPLMMTVVTVIIAVIAHEKMNLGSIFSALGYFSLLKNEAAKIPSTGSAFVRSLAAFDRLAEFLMNNKDDDSHEYFTAVPTVSQPRPSMDSGGSVEGEYHSDNEYVVSVYNASFKWDTQYWRNRQVPEPTKNQKILPQLPSQQFPSPKSPLELQHTLQPEAGMIRQRVPSSVNQGVLVEIDMHIRNQSLVCIAGRAGSGKSSLLHALLGDMRCFKGSVNIFTRKANWSTPDVELGWKKQEKYRSEMAVLLSEPWLSLETIRDNICFGTPMNLQRYLAVLSATGLDQWVVPSSDILPNPPKESINSLRNDLMLIRKTSCDGLSSCEAIQICLARLAYSEAPIVLMDDPLAKFSTTEAMDIFYDCIFEYMKDKTRILVTNEERFLQHADQIFVMKDGRIVESGSFTQLTNNPHSELREIINPQSLPPQTDFHRTQPSRNTKKQTAQRERPLKFNEVSEEMENARRVDLAEQVTFSWVVDREEMKRGTDWSIWYRFLQACGGFKSLIGVLLLFGLCEVGFATSIYWISVMSIDKYQMNMTFYAVIYTCISLLTCALLGLREYLVNSVVNLAANRLHDSALSTLFAAKFQFYEVTEREDILDRLQRDTMRLHIEFSILIRNLLLNASLLIGSQIVIAFTLPWYLINATFVMILFAVVHYLYIPAATDCRRMATVASIPLISHFTSTLDGLQEIRSANQKARFVGWNNIYTDFATTCVYNSNLFAGWLVSALGVVSVLTVLTSGFSSIVSANYFPAYAGLALTYGIQWVQALQALSINLRLIVERSNSVERLVRYTTKIKTEYDAHDLYKSLMSSTEAADRNKFLQDVSELDTFTTVFPMPRPPSILHDSNFHARSQFSTTTAAKLTMIDVVVYHTPRQVLKPPEQYSNSTALAKQQNRHILCSEVRSNSSLQIRGKLTIEARSKCCIIGGAGAGKTTLVSILQRALKPTLGVITINDISISSMPISELRLNIATATGKVDLFSGSIRSNLDPYARFHDHNIWDALAKVGMRTTVEQLPHRLNTELVFNGSVAIFSSTQQQLLCLARLLLRCLHVATPPQIVVLDDPLTVSSARTIPAEDLDDVYGMQGEATSTSTSTASERLVSTKEILHNLIHKELSSRTVIYMTGSEEVLQSNDFDVVLRMNKGVIGRVDSSATLRYSS